MKKSILVSLPGKSAHEPHRLLPHNISAKKNDFFSENKSCQIERRRPIALLSDRLRYIPGILRGKMLSLSLSLISVAVATQTRKCTRKSQPIFSVHLGKRSAIDWLHGLEHRTEGRGPLFLFSGPYLRQTVPCTHTATDTRVRTCTCRRARERRRPNTNGAGEEPSFLLFFRPNKRKCQTRLSWLDGSLPIFSFHRFFFLVGAFSSLPLPVSRFFLSL